jgi:peptidoglycan/xylan/chitin deacetylase (PgdA/CDA1 family)
MSKLRHRLARPWAAASRLARRLMPPPDGAFRILMFHAVPPDERPAFARLVRGLAESGRLITPAEAESLLAGTPLVGTLGRRFAAPPCLLSFDDGFASNAEVAQSILAPLGAKALFFVCPGLMDLSPEIQAERISANVFRGLQPAPEPLMDWAGIEALARAGHAIGNHTAHHLRLSALPPDQAAEEIGGAARMLGDRLGPTPWFAYTFGDIDSINAPSLAEIGRHHRYCRSGIRGLNHLGLGPLALRGDQIGLDGPQAWPQVIVEGGLDPLYRKQRLMLDAMANRS